jgi:hypothetical protein
LGWGLTHQAMSSLMILSKNSQQDANNVFLWF